MVAVAGGAIADSVDDFWTHSLHLIEHSPMYSMLLINCSVFGAFAVKSAYSHAQSTLYFGLVNAWNVMINDSYHDSKLEVRRVWAMFAQSFAPGYPMKFQSYIGNNIIIFPWNSSIFQMMRDLKFDKIGQNTYHSFSFDRLFSFEFVVEFVSLVSSGLLIKLKLLKDADFVG